MIKYSIVIPVYNAETCITSLTQDVIRVMKTLNDTFEIILIDDASSDQSWNNISELKNVHPDLITGIQLAKNFGQHAATLCGLKESKGELIITMDDDYESNPELLPELIRFSQTSGNELVYAEYSNRKNGPLRFILTSVYKRLAKLEGKSKGKGSSFRLIKRDLFQRIKNENSAFVFLDELFLWYTSDIGFYNCQARKSQKKRSTYSIPTLMELTGNVILYSTTIPLRAVKSIGVMLAGFNFLLGIYYLIRKIFFQAPLGYSSIIVSILFSTGMIMICLAVIAEYQGRQIKSSNGSPQYSVRRKL